jgi:FkbM family methyltransferase
MIAGSPTWWVPSALWSRVGRAHLRWKLRQSRADDADRRGRAFLYRHPTIGPFVYHPDDYLSRRVFLFDNFERVELQFALEQARRGGTILDVGANVGLYTVACASAAGDRGNVIALEPGPTTCAKLSHTCRLLGLRNVSTLAVAAAGTNGSAFLVSRPAAMDVHQHLADGRAHEPGDLVEVPTRRLDDLADPETVILLKIDIEGHEVQALQGAKRICANGRARLIVEFYPDGLRAAGTSADQLWDVVADTHRCTAIVRDDGTIVESPADLGPVADDRVWNTLWVPR